MPRIIYVSPRNATPSGGIRTMHRHVQLLRRGGFDAYICHAVDGFRPDWFSDDVPFIYRSELIEPRRLKLFPDDHLVFFEMADKVITFFNQYRGATRHLFCQNQFQMFDALDGLGVKSWQECGVSRAFACAPIIAEAARLCLGFAQVPVVPCAVDTTVFRPGPKTLQIAYMPRKRLRDVPYIRRCFAQAYPALAGTRWMEIEGQTEEKVAQILGESAIFLSLSRREGLGLPPLEAMASGCLVVGFTGIGGRDYADARNGLWCEEDDLWGAANKLAAACSGIERGSPETTAMVEAGRATAARYSVAAMEQALLAYWRAALSAKPLSG
jgi:hypothetical protein